MDWNEYDTQKPDEKKYYEWKIQHKGGFSITFHAKMRMRGNGYAADVLSPSFDYWDGYKVHVPKNLLWREAENQELAAAADKQGIVQINGVKLNPCPFCGTSPSIKASQCGHPGGGGGITVCPSPENYNTWRVSSCCQMIGFNGFSSPITLFEVWNGRTKKTSQVTPNPCPTHTNPVRERRE